jgi:hypothetical protein
VSGDSDKIRDMTPQTMALRREKKRLIEVNTSPCLSVEVKYVVDDDCDIIGKNGCRGSVN